MISALKKKLALYRKNRLVDSLAALSDEDAREVVRYGRKGFHLAKNKPGGPRRKKEGQGNAE